MPLVAALVALAALAGNTVVAAAVTDAWESAQKRFAPLLGRGDPAKTELAEGRLAETHDQLIEANGADLEGIRAGLEAQWATRMGDLLEEDPGVEADLRAWWKRSKRSCLLGRFRRLIMRLRPGGM